MTPEERVLSKLKTDEDSFFDGWNFWSGVNETITVIVSAIILAILTAAFITVVVWVMIWIGDGDVSQTWYPILKRAFYGFTFLFFIPFVFIIHKFY